MRSIGLFFFFLIFLLTTTLASAQQQGWDSIPSWAESVNQTTRGTICYCAVQSTDYTLQYSARCNTIYGNNTFVDPQVGGYTCECGDSSIHCGIGAIIQELSMYEDMPMRRVQEFFKTLLYGDTPLGWDIGGPKSNIKLFQRKDFIKFLERAYIAENIVVGVAGKIDSKTVKQAIAKIFKDVRVGKKPVAKKAVDKQSVPQVFLHNKKVDQTQLVVGVRAFDMFHKDKPVLSVLTTILGGGMSSRMFMEVRERRGLAYSIRTSADLFLDAGYLATQAGVEHGNLEKALKVILGEYKKITEELVGKDELKKAKESIKGRTALGLEGSDDVVEYLVGQEILQNQIITPEDKLKAIDKVTAEDVQRVAKMIFTEKRLNLAVISPNAKKAKLEKLLHL